MKRKIVSDLDQIPWKDLTHAYGSAEDVPDLLRALKTAPPELQGEESPLWHLYGNIWHQGTVYEATAFAVPFLIEIASDPQTLDRKGVLGLLADIAKGESYRVCHNNLLNELDFEEKKSRELKWVKDAHDAVARGYSTLAELTTEPSDVRLAAAHVLAQLPNYAVQVGSIVREMLDREVRGLNRAGLLLLLGQSGDRSNQTLSILSAAVNHDDNIQRRAAAMSIARLRLIPLPPGARNAIIEVFIANDLQEGFVGLPWDAEGEINRDDLLACLDSTDKEQIADRLISLIETGKATQADIATLIDMLFSSQGREKVLKLTPQDLSARQLRAVQSLYATMKRGKRISYVWFPSWGLPDTIEEWRILANSHKSAFEAVQSYVAQLFRVSPTL